MNSRFRRKSLCGEHDEKRVFQQVVAHRKWLSPVVPDRMFKLHIGRGDKRKVLRELSAALISFVLACPKVYMKRDTVHRKPTHGRECGLLYRTY